MSWKEKYIKMIGCVNPNELQIDPAQLLKIRNLPRYLYKFRKVTPDSLTNLRDGTVWLNSPAKYNDPFDCVEYTDFQKAKDIQTQMNFENIIKEIQTHIHIPTEIITEARNSTNPLKYITKYWLKNVESRSEEEFRNFEKAIESASNKNMTQMITERNRMMQSAMKICSFCESANNILMWSHYADKHKGFCVEYDLSQLPTSDIRKRLLYPVIYSNDLYDSTEHFIFQIRNKSFNNLYPIISCSTKSKFWEYEQEWRMIFNIGPDFSEQNYNMDCQSKVFVGIRVAESDKQKIISICKQKNMKLFQSIQSLKKYELHFEEVNIGIE